MKLAKLNRQEKKELITAAESLRLIMLIKASEQDEELRKLIDQLAFQTELILMKIARGDRREMDVYVKKGDDLIEQIEKVKKMRGDKA